MTDFQRLAYAADEDLSLVGILADWLEENARTAGRIQAAVLLRRRWRRWLTEAPEFRARAEAFIAECTAKVAAEPNRRQSFHTDDWVIRIFWRPDFPERTRLLIQYKRTPDITFRRYLRQRFASRRGSRPTSPGPGGRPANPPG